MIWPIKCASRINNWPLRPILMLNVSYISRVQYIILVTTLTIYIKIKRLLYRWSLKNFSKKKSQGINRWWDAWLVTCGSKNYPVLSCHRTDTLQFDLRSTTLLDQVFPVKSGFPHPVPSKPLRVRAVKVFLDVRLNPWNELFVRSCCLILLLLLAIHINKQTNKQTRWSLYEVKYLLIYEIFSITSASSLVFLRHNPQLLTISNSESCFLFWLRVRFKHGSLANRATHYVET